MSGVHAVQWGILHEAEAIAEYSASHDVVVQPSGIWLSQCGILGGSSDGILSSDTLIEVKCPYSVRQTPLLELCKD